jgi:hypothetical protein
VHVDYNDGKPALNVIVKLGEPNTNTSDKRITDTNARKRVGAELRCI